MKIKIFGLISIIFSTGAFACNGDGEFKPFIKVSLEPNVSCNDLYVYIPSKLNTLELSAVTYTLDAKGEVSIPSMYVDASDLGDFTAKGYSLSQLCAPKANLDKIKVTVSYQPPIGPNGELTFCLSNKEFMLSELSDL
ncbi:hypothetical protein [uncultured Pseudoalteromonas sp.]|uniref:hypothetical protein n=1 Tax=Pseudoalteromonas sp. NFXS39 TaxID=2818437 RepID=UPI0032B1C9C2